MYYNARAHARPLQFYDVIYAQGFWRKSVRAKQNGRPARMRALGIARVLHLFPAQLQLRTLWILARKLLISRESLLIFAPTNHDNVF